MKSNLKQLTLNLCLKDAANFANFFVENNQQLMSILKTWHTRDDMPFIYIWGDTSSGKTHLLEAVCRQFNARHLTVAYLPLEDAATLDIKLLDDLETVDLLVCDNLEAIVGNDLWEEKILHCFNRCLMCGRKIIITANVAPQLLSLELPDLKSRMSSGLIFALRPLSDEGKIEALKLHALARGLELPDQVARFLLNKYSRTLKNLVAILERLDGASLAAQHKLTIPFIKDILGI